MTSHIHIHPTVDNGLKPGSKDFTGGTLACKCQDKPVTVAVDSQVAHNHACGCTKCWKPEGSLFSVVGVVPRDKVRVTANEDKLKVVDLRRRSSATPARCAAFTCIAASRTRNIPSTGWTSFTRSFRRKRVGIRPSLPPSCRRLSELGADPAQMGAVRGRLKELGLEPYDCLSPPLMDAIATHVAKASGVLKSAA